MHLKEQFDFELALQTEIIYVAQPIVRFVTLNNCLIHP